MYVSFNELAKTYNINKQKSNVVDVIRAVLRIENWNGKSGKLREALSGSDVFRFSETLNTCLKAYQISGYLQYLT